MKRKWQVWNRLAAAAPVSPYPGIAPCRLHSRAYRRSRHACRAGLPLRTA